MKYELIKLVGVGVLIMAIVINVTDAKLVAYWEFDDLQGSMTRDKCGNNDGTLKGKPYWTEGHFGGALKFPRSSLDSVYIKHNPIFNIKNEITVAAWIKIEGIEYDHQAIITKGNSSWRLQRFAKTGGIEFACTGLNMSDNPWGHIIGTVNVNDGKWHHVAGVYDGQKIYIYIDGALDISQNASGKISTNTFGVCIGSNAEVLYCEWKGCIDDAILFDHALNKDEIFQLYTDGGISFFIPILQKIENTLKEADTLKEKTPLKVIDLLEKEVAKYKEWREKNLEYAKDTDWKLSDLYFQLAKAKEAAGFSKEAIAAEYKHVIFSSKEGGNALVYLFANTSAEEYKESINTAFHNCTDKINIAFRNDTDRINSYGNISRQLEESGNWNAFKLFLNVLFSNVEDPVVSAKKIESGLNEDGVWRGEYYEYCSSKSNLINYVCEVPEAYIENGDIEKGITAYRSLMNRYDSAEQKADLEFRICKCLFNAGNYQAAISELNSVLAKNKYSNKKISKDLFLLRGQCYIQLGEVDKASNEFLSLIIEYPETKQAPEANFFVGYCYMLQGKFDQAKEALSLVVKDYPQSSYAGKAKLCLTRIESMTEK
jgi:tetratricopeptide (TPR) repeat protein